jgi:hypothetical protein
MSSKFRPHSCIKLTHIKILCKEDRKTMNLKNTYSRRWTGGSVLINHMQDNAHTLQNLPKTLQDFVLC